MGSCWIRLPDPEDPKLYDFENDDYGLPGPPDEITIGDYPMTLDDYSHISLHPNDDGAATWLLMTQQGTDAPRTERKHMPGDQAQQLLRELRLRARTKPKQGNVG